MATFIGKSDFITKEARETQDCGDRVLTLNPWNVQNIVYKIIQEFMLTNEPKSLGYTFDQKYAIEKEKSQIDLDIAFNFKPETAGKRPAIYVTRAEAQYKYPTMGMMIGRNAAESERTKLALVSLPIVVRVIASPVGFVEQLADYVRQPLTYFAQTIQCDFGFDRFRLVSVGHPQIYSDNKDNFIVELNLQVEYRDNWVVRGDDLKLKTFSATIFDAITKKPLELQ